MVVSFKNILFNLLLKNASKSLVIQLYDLRIFDSPIHCEDQSNNIVKLYKIECSNCESKYFFIVLIECLSLAS